MHNERAAMTDARLSLLDRFQASRKHSTNLIRDLSPEDCQAQSMDDASPAKWHLAHVTWFYEVMVLKHIVNWYVVKISLDLLGSCNLITFLLRN